MEGGGGLAVEVLQVKDVEAASWRFYGSALMMSINSAQRYWFLWKYYQLNSTQ